jgi:hemoglobin
MSRHDILTRADIELLITDFYKKVRLDAQLAPHFTNIDWAHHTPIITDFWCMLLLGDPSYKGNPLQRHLHLQLQNEDFEQWLHLFKTTIDEHFEGEKALEAKQRAENIAGMFRFKLGIG